MVQRSTFSRASIKTNLLAIVTIIVNVQELMWYDEALSAELRSGPISSFADR